jgi:hypothetical protein
MSFELASPAIRAHSLSKRYVLYGNPFDRLKQFFRPNALYGREFWAVEISIFLLVKAKYSASSGKTVQANPPYYN